MRKREERSRQTRPWTPILTAVLSLGIAHAAAGTDFPPAPPGAPIASPYGLAALVAGIVVGGILVLRYRHK